MKGFRQTIDFDLKELLESLFHEQHDLEEIYIFGSRAYGTGSLRSDCDLLVRPSTGKNVKASDLREFALSNCEALDFFLVEGGTARSCSNDSYVFAASFEELIVRLDGVLLWRRQQGFTDFAFRTGGGWTFSALKNSSFPMSTLPDEYLSQQAWLAKIKAVEQSGLPVRPYLGDTLDKAVLLIQEVARKMIFRSDQLPPKGQARGGWTVNLQNEYDCQSLFYSVVKPWLPELAREEVTVSFDGQKKLSDFSLFRGKLIIEMKFISDAVSKASVGKTLAGLSEFYSRNANVGCLLVIVYVKSGTVGVDKGRWESEFTSIHTAPSVITIVIEVP